MTSYDVVVVGLGHAGAECALACARLGLSTAAVTLNPAAAGTMSCNPSIGGTAKGHLVRELDALGGEMGRAADIAGTQFITLNSSRGPAVRATRALCDRDVYAETIQAALATQPNLTIIKGEVAQLLTEFGSGRSRVMGVRLTDAREVHARAVVLTTGTFLQALMHQGSERTSGGRVGEASASQLSASLTGLGFELGRFKTGTPARLMRDTIDASACTVQSGDAMPTPFSLRTDAARFPARPQLECLLTHTNERTHSILRENLAHSPLFSGRITGVGPRYCPSVEDKVVRFAERDRHVVFLQPEGNDSPLVYPAGLSTSMPAEVQLRFLRSIPGLEGVEVARFGYAVEYDYAPPTQLRPTLETKRVDRLYFAGQLNGTSGYEEAAFQGLLAGANVALAHRGEPELVLRRDEAHGGVLIDELVSRGVDEPFRMLTSRSEHRLALREGNAEFRLRHHGHRVGLVSPALHAATVARWTSISGELSRLREAGLLAILKRPGAGYHSLPETDRQSLPPDIVREVEVEAKYEGYVSASRAAIIRRADSHDDLRIPRGLNWAKVDGLSAEIKEKLGRLQPDHLGQVRRIPGVTPPALGLIALHLRRVGCST